jgi:hypothetical protein
VGERDKLWCVLALKRHLVVSIFHSTVRHMKLTLAHMVIKKSVTLLIFLGSVINGYEIWFR